MEIGALPGFRCVDNPFLRGNHIRTNNQPENWAAFNSNFEQTLGNFPDHPAQNSAEDDDWFISCEGISPFSLLRDFTRETSVPVENLKNEILWPEQRHDSFQQSQEAPLLYQNSEQSSSTCRRDSSQATDTSVEANCSATKPTISVQAVKRKRGRPRLYSPMTEKQDTDVFGTHVSSAREVHLQKNRIAANKSRRRRKELAADLKANVADLTSKNTALKAEETLLRERVLNLKNEVLRHARCGSWAIDRYVARSASDLLGVTGPSSQMPGPKDSSKAQLLTVPTRHVGELVSEPINEPGTSQGTIDAQVDLETDEILWLLNEGEILED
ncbi:hypothetical protein EKO04_007687 [Ascochyta lentis]|uniref:BZIP domain-containing protein n=1 Tax=Ascochyta lentis TaxID=205686 RepID=A0A8H7J0P3_9PLEO|nr:hypothetical protein EKO04_007687 [Ascochyta lentis]